VNHNDNISAVLHSEHLAKELVPPAEASGMSAEKPFHLSNQRRLRRFDHQMKMVEPSGTGQAPASRSCRKHAQSADELLPLRVIVKNGFAPVTQTSR